MNKRKFKLAIRKKFFTECAETLEQVPREVDDPTLTVFKARLDKAYWEVYLPMAGELEIDDL